MSEYNHLISNHNGVFLRLTPELYEEYKREEEALMMRYYAIVRDEAGVWASNQRKFVESPSELNDLDNHTMEDKYAEYMVRNAGKVNTVVKLENREMLPPGTYTIQFTGVAVKQDPVRQPTKDVKRD